MENGENGTSRNTSDKKKRINRRIIISGLLPAAFLAAVCIWNFWGKSPELLEGRQKESQTQTESSDMETILADEKNLEGQEGCNKAEDVLIQPQGSEFTAFVEHPDGKVPEDGQTTENEAGDEPPQTMSIVMVGDILLHTRVNDCARREDGSYDYKPIFAGIKTEIQAADLALVNQEVIIGGKELGVTGYPTFNAPGEIGDALIDAGFDVICHATNHALDRNAQGIRNTLSFWRENYPDIGVVGIYDDAEEQKKIYTCERNGITVAILNYTYGTNGIPLPADMPYAVNLLNEERIVADLKKAREVADFTIVVPHWGTEYVLEQTKEQEKWAQLFLENGADLVLGAHPHVIEPIEWMEDENGNQMLVYYSVGNFVSWSGEVRAGVADRMVGGIAKIELKREEDGRVAIDDYGVEPVVCHVEEGQDKIAVYRLSDYTEELAERNAIRWQDGNFSLQYCRDLCERVWQGIKMGD